MNGIALDISNFSGLDESIMGKYSNVISKSTLLSTAPVKTTTMAVNPLIKPTLSTTTTTSTPTATRPTLSAPTTTTTIGTGGTTSTPTSTAVVSPTPVAVNPDLKQTLLGGAATSTPPTVTYVSPPQVLVTPITPVYAQPVVDVVNAQPSGGFGGGGYAGGGSGDSGGAEDTGAVENAGKKVLVEEKSNKMKLLGLLIGAAGGYFYATKNNKNLMAFTLIGSAIGVGIGFYIEKNK
jgi:hypothetical protein